MSATATSALLGQPEEKVPIPLGPRDLLRDGAQRRVPAVAVLETQVGHLNHERIAAELLHDYSARHRRFRLAACPLSGGLGTAVRRFLPIDTHGSSKLSNLGRLSQQGCQH